MSSFILKRVTNKGNIRSEKKIGAGKDMTKRKTYNRLTVKEVLRI